MIPQIPASMLNPKFNLMKPGLLALILLIGCLGSAQTPVVQKEYSNHPARSLINSIVLNTDEVTGHIILKILVHRSLTFSTHIGVNYSCPEKRFTLSQALTPALFSTANDVYHYQAKVRSSQRKNFVTSKESLAEQAGMIATKGEGHELTFDLLHITDHATCVTLLFNLNSQVGARRPSIILTACSQLINFVTRKERG
jgi:hypothetical protein